MDDLIADVVHSGVANLYFLSMFFYAIYIGTTRLIVLRQSLRLLYESKKEATNLPSCVTLTLHGSFFENFGMVFFYLTWFTIACFL